MPHHDDRFGSITLFVNTFIKLVYFIKTYTLIGIFFKGYLWETTQKTVIETLHYNSFTINFLRSQITGFIESFIINVCSIPAFLKVPNTLSYIILIKTLCRKGHCYLYFKGITFGS